MDAVGKSSQRADRQAQKLAQLQDLKKSQAVPSTAPKADQARSGQGGQDTALQAQWLAAIKSAVTQSWLRPDNLPKSVCPVDITQIPGGSVINVHIESGCPYDEVGRKSIQNAVMRAQPLPYQGYEKVFKRQITLNFQVND
jgi:colicin import membrane protein